MKRSDLDGAPVVVESNPGDRAERIPCACWDTPTVLEQVARAGSARGRPASEEAPKHPLRGGYAKLVTRWGAA